MLKWLLLSCVVKQMQLSLQVFKAKDISEYEVSHVAVKSQLWHFSTCTALACRPSTETTKCSCCKVCSQSLQLSLKARVPQVVKTIILIVGLGGGGKDYIDLETEFCHCLQSWSIWAQPCLWNKVSLRVSQLLLEYDWPFAFFRKMPS